jgi:hypothetical protein
VVEASQWSDYPPLQWSDVRKAFVVEGSLRDIVIDPAGGGVWQGAIEYVATIEREGRATTSWEPSTISDASAALALVATGSLVSLTVTIDGLLIKSFLHDPDELEFDVDPREVTTPGSAVVLLGFMAGVARAVGRPIHLTPESAHDNPWLTFEPTSGIWSFVDLSDDDPGTPWQSLPPDWTR